MTGKVKKLEIEQDIGYFEGADRTLEQKEEFIHTIWLIMDHFVVHRFKSISGSETP